jgi:hypothetical protein
VTRRWFQLRHLEAATGVPRRTLKTWADDGRLPSTRFADGHSWRLFGADAIATLESMGIPVRDTTISTILTNDEIDDDSEDNEA